MIKQIVRLASVLVLVGSAACSDGGGDGIVDPPVTNTAPVMLPVLGLGAVPERFTSELWVHGSYAYTGSWSRRGVNVGNALKIWNVSGTTPVLVDSVIVSDATTLGDVEVSDDGKLLVVATERSPGSIVVFDLANPAKPRQVSRFSNANTAPGVHTAEIERVSGRLYAFLSVDPGQGVPAKLVIVDLADPANPREVFSQAMGDPYVHDVFVRNGILFTANWDEGAVIWDIGGGGRGGSPSNPVRISVVQTVGGNVHNLYWDGKRYLFVGEEGPPYSGDIHVVDVTSLAQPREVAFFTVAGSGTHNFSVDEASGILYAAYYTAGVRALDIRGDLGGCTAEQKTTLGGVQLCDLSKMGREVGRGLTDYGSQVQTWGVQFVGTHLYASDMLNGLFKLNVSALKR